MSTRNGQKCDGRSTDLELNWLTNIYGHEWEEWRSLGAQWLVQQDTGLSHKCDALTLFFETYMVNSAPWASSVCVFFEGYQGEHHCSSEDFKTVVLKNTKCSENVYLSNIINNISEFLDWLLDAEFSEPNNHGVPIRFWLNPFQKMKRKYRLTETVRTPLPYRIIQDLRQILCPNPEGSFSDWTWAQKTGSSDWDEYWKYHRSRSEARNYGDLVINGVAS